MLRSRRWYRGLAKDGIRYAGPGRGDRRWFVGHRQPHSHPAARAGLYACDEPPNVLIDLTLGMAAKNRSPADVGARTVEILSAAYDSARAGAVPNIVTRHRSSTATP